MPGPSVDIGREIVVFLDGQAAFKTIATDNPVAADALRVKRGNFSGKAAFLMREDRYGTDTKVGKIDQHRTAEGEVEAYLMSSGTPGTAPDLDEALVYGGWRKVTGSGSTTFVLAGSTTSVLNVASTAGITAGSCVIIAGIYLRRVTAIGAGPDITVSPALPALPANGVAVKSGVLYRPDDARADGAEPDALTAWAMNNRSAERVIGFVPTGWSFMLGGDQAPNVTFRGVARRHDRLSATLLNGAINNAVTTIPVDSGLVVPQDVSATSPVYFQVDSEVLKVIGVSGNNLTVDTRGVYLGGGAAAAHLDNAEVYPYQPAGTYAGSPIPASSGDCIVGAADLQVSQAQFDVEMAVTERQDEHGDAYKLSGYTPQRRSVKVRFQGWSYFDTAIVRALEAAQRTAVQAFIEAGAAEGAMVAVECPTIRFEIPALDRGGDEVSLELSGEAEGTVTGEDEVYLMFG